MEEILMGEEAARYLGVTYSRLHQLTKAGIGKKVSGHWVFSRAELDTYRESEKDVGGRPPKIDGLSTPQPTRTIGRPSVILNG